MVKTPIRPGCMMEHIISPCLEGTIHVMNTEFGGDHLSKVIDSRCLWTSKADSVDIACEEVRSQGYASKLYSETVKTKDTLLYLDCGVYNYAVYAPVITRARMITSVGEPYVCCDNVQGYYSRLLNTADEARDVFSKSADILVTKKLHVFDGYGFSLISNSQRKMSHPMSYWSFEWRLVEILDSPDEFTPDKQAGYPSLSICVPQRLYIASCNREIV